MTQSQEPHGQEDEKPAREEDGMGTPHSAASEADAETEASADPAAANADTRSDDTPTADEADPAPEQSSAELSPDDVIAELQAQIAALKDQALRAAAEAENVRRRAAKEKADASKYGISNLARDLLSVPDNLTRAIDSVTEEAQRAGGETLQTLMEGVKLTQKELLQVLERHGIQPIHPEGEKFDPNFHQAMFEAPGTGQPDGTVVQVVQTGYLIGERLLRPAMVGVAKGGTAAQSENGQTESAQAPGSQLDTSA